MTRKIKFVLTSLFVTGWIFLFNNTAWADEPVVQTTDNTLVVTPPQSITDTATATVTVATVEIQAAQTNLDNTKTVGQSTLSPVTNEVIQVIHEAQVAIDQATSTVNQVQTQIQNVTDAQSSVSSATQVVEVKNIEVVIAQTNLQTATNEVTVQTAVVEQANTSLTNAQVNVTTTTTAVETQMQVVAEAQINLNNANTNLASADTAVQNQIPVVESAQANKDAAQSVVNANTSPGLVMTVYSNPGTNGSPAMGGNLVYTGTDTDGINEQWGGSGPTVNSGTTTVTETFNNNQLNTNIGIAVNGTPVSTTNNNNVYIASIGWPSSAGVGSDPSLTLRQPTAVTTITMPTGTTSAGFSVFAKNGNTTGTITYTDGTTESYVIQDDVNPNYPNYVHQETFIAPAGKTIANVTIPTDWDYFAIDNVSATKPNTAVVTDDFQVRWQGLWTPQTTGTQYIYAPADDGVKLYLDGQLVINDWVDKGGGGSTADVPTTAGISKTFDMWYYENGGGANVALKRYTGSGWEVIPASEFSTSTATTAQINALTIATNTLNTETATLNTLQATKVVAQNNVNAANATLSSETSTLNSNISAQSTAIETANTAQTTLTTEQAALQVKIDTQSSATTILNTKNTELSVAQTDLGTAQSNLNTAQINLDIAVAAVQPAITNMNNLVTSSNNLVTQTIQMQAQQRAAAAAAAAASSYVPPIPEPPTPPTDTPSNPDQTPTEPTVDPTPSDSSTDTPSDTTDTTGTTDSTDQTGSDTTNTDSSNQDNSSSNNTDTSSQPTDSTSIPTDNTQTQPDPTPAPTPEPTSQDKSTPESTPGLVENNPNSLPETTPKLPEPSLLVAHIQVDKPGVENGGIEFFGTKSQPQVVGEDGKLTPPPPPPGSGLPIPPDAITTAETFIGQPGGTAFNAPDIAVPVIMTYVCTTIQKDGKEIHIDVNGDEHPVELCTFLPAALDAIPGAGEAIQALGAAYANLANIGNDMSPLTRKKAKKVLVLTAAVVAFRRRFGND